MSEQPGDELPLTADAFQRPAASRRNVTSRVIRIHPPDADAQASPTEGVAPTDPLEPQFAQPSGQSAPPSPVHATADPRAAWQPSVPDPSVPDCAPTGYPAPGGQPQPWHYAAPPPGQATYPPPSTSFAPSQHPSLPAQPGVPPDAHLTDYGYEQFTAAARQAAAEPPAEWGWRGRVRRLTGGLVAPGMSREEAAYKGAVRQVQVTLPGPKTIVFVNPKGGASTTTSTLMAARTFGVHRGGSVIAWDNNETRGTLGSRAMPAQHANTARELLDNIGVFEGSATARIGDLGRYVRGQGPAFFDVLASDDRADVTGHIDAGDVARLHRLFQRFYRLILIDTGNNIRAQNWLTAVGAADLVVVTTVIRQDSAESALWMIDALEKHVYGPGGLKPRAITVLAEPTPTYDMRLRSTMEGIFGGRTHAVFRIPYDPALVDGGVIDYDRISSVSHRAWLFACAGIASAL